jgi:hypothetical protein
MKNWGRRGLYAGCWIFFSGFEEFGFGVLVNHCRGHRVAGLWVMGQ